MELSENEKRRASNLIWNAARDYTFEPDFRVFDREGRAELYWNCIIGAAWGHFDRAGVNAFLHSFEGSVAQLLYENLTWLAMENVIYLREAGERPALPALRREYAGRVVLESRAEENDRLLDVLETAHFQRALGVEPTLKPRDLEILNALELPAQTNTAQLVDRLQTVFTEYLEFKPMEGETAGGEKRDWQGIHFQWFLHHRRDNRVPLPAVRGFAFGFGSHTEGTGGAEVGRGSLTFQLPLFSSATAESLREYITNYFGPLCCPEKQLREMEKDYCTGNHRTCHLHMTRGISEDKKLAQGYAGAQKRAIIKQAAKNRVFYEEHLAQNRNSINRLTNRLRNTLLTHLESTVVKSGAGKLVGGRVWRGVYLNDPKIFEKVQRGDTGNLSVDILLDGSTSQLNRQETVATQCYIIAESLTRCGLPVRVTSFCSMSGYTVVNLFRDYHETRKNENIFNYYTNGCNRDGLGIRMTAGQLQKTDCEHKLLILLSDAKPNDVLKVETEKNLYRDYTEQVGINDTAAEVHRARMNGISVICVFTGNDEDLPAARAIYGRDFTRIRSVEQFSDTVGALIQNQIKNL